MSTIVLFESLNLIEATVTGERQVRQRLIKAGMSQNRRQYSEAVLRKATALFEGARTYANHPQPGARGDRSVREITGWLEGVTFADGALWATRHFTRNQAGADSWALVEDILTGRAPSALFGASINAFGKAQTARDDSGEYVMVESIDVVHSVDDVSNPAAGGGFALTASADGDLTRALLALLSYEEWLEARTDFAERLKRELKAARQDEALKAATADAQRAIAALSEAQQALEAARQSEARLQADLTLARRNLALIDVLEGTSLPVPVRRQLREQLEAVDPSQWTAQISRITSMLKSAGAAVGRVNVQGAGQSVAAEINKLPAMPAALNMDELDTPEKLADYIERIRTKS